MTVAKRNEDAVSDTKKGWELFDRQQWGESRECFLDALSDDPHNQEAAEGLIMSVYHGDSPRVAYELGQKLSPKMPWLPDMVSEAVAGKAEQLISEGEFGAASALLSELPASENKLSELRKSLENRKEPAKAKPQKAEDSLPSAVEFIKQKQKQKEEQSRKPEVYQPRPKAPSGAPKEKDLYAAALEAYRDSRFRTSLWYLDHSPDSGPKWQTLKGWNLLETDRFEEAVVVFEELYRNDSHNPEVALGLWNSLYRLDALDYAFELKNEVGGVLASLEDSAFIGDDEPLDNSCGYRQCAEPERELNHFVFADLDR